MTDIFSDDDDDVVELDADQFHDGVSTHLESSLSAWPTTSIVSQPGSFAWEPGPSAGDSLGTQSSTLAFQTTADRRRKPYAPEKNGKQRTIGPTALENAAETTLVDRLTAEYSERVRRTSLRCLVKLLLNMDWVHEKRSIVIAEIDSYAGGPGSTTRKIQDRKNGDQVDTIDSKCLVRAAPQRFYYDRTPIVAQCDKCGQQHDGQMQRGFHDAIFLGLYDHAVHDHEFPLHELILDGFYEASHVCHDPPCSDPFHVERESGDHNWARNLCRPTQPRPCTHLVPCRLIYHWSDPKNWESVWPESREAKRDVVALWRCSKGCKGTGKHSNDGAFTTINHWTSGTKVIGG